MPSEVIGVKVVTGNGSDIQGCDKRLHPVVNLELTSALVQQLGSFCMMFS